ncbi:NADH-dependent dehydrogenase [Devosia yakushimensis]|uniref:NADH-dependent dehydrogenase n=1 Tax=Devosia yakushimensis TaxID=470028 RepID=A0ABQ5UH47_9HYPH|nr:Gfo/Idh/MocA family oxidoreductase [Devosia yakushimensis]GLQ10525.1 NADH-dependent dehydrogenase [Devosia yakushimensis]
MTPRLRLCTLGAGYFSQFHYRAWARIAEVELVGICDRNAAAAQKVAAGFPQVRIYGDLATMLDVERPDLLDIIVPPAGHPDAIRAAAERGIAMICQKPFCGALGAAEAATALAERHETPLIVHENFRFQPWYEQLAQVLASGRLGQIYNATFRLRPGDGQGPDAYLDRQPYFRDMERLLIHETGIHLVDVFRSLFGEVEAVSARLRRLNSAIRGEDAALVTLEMSNGTLATLDANRLSDHAATNKRLTMGEMLIEAENGSISLDGNGEIRLRDHGALTSSRIDYAWTDNDFGGDCVYRTQAAAVAAIQGGTTPVNTARDYLTNLRIEEAIYASHNQGRRIVLS